MHLTLKSPIHPQHILSPSEVFFAQSQQLFPIPFRNFISARTKAPLNRIWLDKAWRRLAQKLIFLQPELENFFFFLPSLVRFFPTTNLIVSTRNAKWKFIDTGSSFLFFWSRKARWTSGPMDLKAATKMYEWKLTENRFSSFISESEWKSCW